MEILFIWVCFGVATAIVASSKGKSFGGWFLLGIVLGPFGLLFAFLAKKDGPTTGEIKCPFCAEYVKDEAVVCKFCGKDLPKLNSSLGWKFVKISKDKIELYKKQCPKCGSINNKDANNCSKCKWIPEIVVHSLDGWVNMQTSGGGTVVRYKTCPNCKEKYHLEAKGCLACGWDPKMFTV